MNAERIDAKGCGLVLVDYQTRLMPAIHNAAHLTANGVLLARVARTLGIPVIGTEQNPAGLGSNVESIRTECNHTIAKMHFDACGDGLLELLQDQEVDHVVIAGCEAHVCMLQTALGLLRAQKRVWAVANASGSRQLDDHATAMNRLAVAGAVIVSTEMVIFEWLERSDQPHFRKVLQLIKAASSGLPGASSNDPHCKP